MKGIRDMSEATEGPGIGRRFAEWLGELEDEHTRLVNRHAELLKEAEEAFKAIMRQADEVAAEIERIEAVRTAMTGKPARRKPGPKPRALSAPSVGTRREADATAAAERVAKITEYGKSIGGTFTGRQAAEAVGMKFQGVGPILAGMVRRGEATVDEADGTRVYTLVGAS